MREAKHGAFKIFKESTHNIPIIHEVDIAVIGGTTAAVAAAAAAATAKASVFLAAPRPYLGEDMCQTYRLWLEKDESPDSELSRKIFAPLLKRKGFNFTYESSLPGVPVQHDPERTGEVMLNDGLWGHACGHSLRYDGNVTITAALPARVHIGDICLVAHQKHREYGVREVRVSGSDDKLRWRPIGVIRNTEPPQNNYVDRPLILSCGVNTTASYIKLDIILEAGAGSALVGQLLIYPKKNEEDLLRGLINTTPMRVKRALDDEMLRSGAAFLYESAPGDVLRKRNGVIDGVTIVNRAGRQAVRAKIIIDATERACVARMAGASFAPYPKGEQIFQRVVIGGKIRTGHGLTARVIPLRFPLGGCPPIERGAGEFGRKVHELNSPMSKEYHEVIEYTVKINMKDSSLRSFAEAEQKARDMTFHPGQADASERLFQIPPDPVTCRKKHNGEWFGAEKLDLDALCPAGLENIIILSACADISRSAAKSMSRPLEMAALGRRVGMEVAAHASRGRTRLKTIARAESSLIEPRPWNLSGKTVRTRKNTIPVAGEYDVVIIGGGTSGASAAVAAARAGVKTLVVEYLCGLGGVSTSGMIGMYCGGYRKGFTAELENGVRKIKAESYIVGKMEYWRSEIRAAGGDMLFGTVCTEAIIKNGGFKGVIVGSDNGRAAILSSVVIDCTGNADMAAAAGAECVVGGTSHFCVQRTGIPPRELGANYINSDWTYVLDSDMTDRFTAFLSARRFNGDAYDLSQIIDSRERRRIKGELTLSAMDIVNARTFSDTICVSESKTFDKHGQPAHPYYHINNFPGGISYIPYRAIIPKDLDGLLVAGIGCAADCDALPSIRMQPEMQNLGYAAGIAAAMAARNGGGVRDIDIRELQRRLVSAGCLPPDVLSHHDAAPLSDERINAAVKKLREDDYSDLKCVMAEPERSVSALRKALGKHGNTAGKLRCAHALGMLGDPSGVKILIDEVEKHRSFDGDIIGHWFPNITWLDSYILGLGHSGDQRAVTPLLEKLDSLLSLKGVQWSNHLESVIAALETLASRRAAEPVCKLLRKELENGGALTLTGEESLEKRSTLGMHALLLAECLFKCGDQRGFARKVLESFSKDIRGYFAIRAREILSKNRNKLPKGVLKKCL